MKYLLTIVTTFLMTIALVACDEGFNRSVVQQKDGIVVIMADRMVDGKEASGIGTGFFIDENVIMTNYHVVGDAKTIKVALESSLDFHDAELIHGDPVADLAIIQIKDWGAFSKDHHYRILKFASPTDLHVGEEVYAIGHPWGLAWTVSRGILSAVDRKPSESPKVLLQVDANIYQGNSGGPLFNTSGEVIGVNSLMMSRDGGTYGFALPVSMIMKVMNDWEKYGEPRWSVLGITMKANTINEVIVGSAAERAGLKKDDVIIEFETSDGSYDPLNKSMPVAMAHHDSGQPVFVKIKRGPELLEVKVDPDWRPSSEIELTPQDGQ